MIYPWANLQVGLAKHQEQANAEQDFCSYAYLFALLYTIYILKAEIFRDASFLLKKLLRKMKLDLIALHVPVVDIDGKKPKS